jgi:hypothetical protein
LEKEKDRAGNMLLLADRVALVACPTCGKDMVVLISMTSCKCRECEAICQL